MSTFKPVKEPKVQVNFQLLGDRIAVLPDPEVTQVGSFHLPDIAIERPHSGLVVAIGDGITDTYGIMRPLRLQVNDRVQYSKYSGFAINIEGQELLIMREEDILLYYRN